MIAVLLILSIMLVLGLGLLTQKSRQYEAAARVREAAQARALAQAGLVDFEIKMRKDPSFPPRRRGEAISFTYTEELMEPGGGTAGRYKVQILSDYEKVPFQFLRVISTGEKGQASYSLYGEWELSPTARPDSSQPNPDFMTWLHIVEQEIPY